MRHKISFLFISTLIIIVLGVIVPEGFAQTCSGREDCQKKIEEYSQKLNALRQQKATLASEIQYMDIQIYLTTLKIKTTEHDIVKTEEEIVDLGEKIGLLNESLNHLSEILLAKISESYKKRRTSVLDVLLNTQNATTFAQSIKYLKISQDSDRRTAFKIQQTKFNFEEQKQLREQKKQELAELKKLLDTQQIALQSQKQSKQKLLEVTKNDERTYQTLLERARAEYAAIAAIVSGGGTETAIRDVKTGEIIASVLPGASCNSTGSHLHFIVKEGGEVRNPFNYLKSVDSRNCSGSSCDSGDGDSFNPSGSWDWPLNPTIEMFQGYGETWAVRNTWVGRIYSFHNGIDIEGSSLDVKAVADGKLYKGGFSGQGGCTLPYVKLEHTNSNAVTYYLHVLPR